MNKAIRCLATGARKVLLPVANPLPHPLLTSGSSALNTARRQPPRVPEEYECCGNGCDSCVWDSYFTEQAAYMKWKRSQPSAPGKKDNKAPEPTA